jgi:hypothetical protein
MNGQCYVSTRVTHADGGGCRVPFRPEVTLQVVPWACAVVDLVQVPAVSSCPRGVLKDFGLLPSRPVVPLGLLLLLLQDGMWPPICNRWPLWRGQGSHDAGIGTCP